MTTNRYRSIACHLLAVLLGIGLAAWSRRGNRTTGDVVVHELVRDAGTKGPDLRVRREGDRTAKVEAHAEAWKLLLLASVPGEEKTGLELNLLREWSEEDLEAALGAALDEGRLAGDNRLLGAFEERMRSDPEQFWPWVRDGHFESRSRELEDKWIGEVATHQTEVLLRHLPDFGMKARVRAIIACVSSVDSQSPDFERMLDRVTALPDTRENEQVWQQAGLSLPLMTSKPERAISLKAVVDEFLSLSGRPGRQQLLMWNLQRMAGSESKEEHEAQLARLPTAVREVIERWGVSRQMSP